MLNLHTSPLKGEWGSVHGIVTKINNYGNKQVKAYATLSKTQRQLPEEDL